MHASALVKQVEGTAFLFEFFGFGGKFLWMCDRFSGLEEKRMERSGRVVSVKERFAVDGRREVSMVF